MEQRPTPEEPLDQGIPSLTPVVPADYDSPWKEAIEQYFPDFMAFFFPDGLDEAPRRLKLAPGPRLSPGPLPRTAGWTVEIWLACNRMSSSTIGCAMSAKIINRGRGPEIEGTRITVYDVFDYVSQGWHRDRIAALFRLSSRDIQAALDYIQQHRDEVTASYQSMRVRQKDYQYAPDI